MRLAPVLLLVVALLAGCSDQSGKDTDGDGLRDHEEEAGWTIEVRLEGRAVRLHVTSDPNLADTDGDGLSDQVEFLLGTDPRDIDTDDDSLSDCHEALHSDANLCGVDDIESDGGIGTDPTKWDSAPGPTYWGNQKTFLDFGGFPERPVAWGSGVGDATMWAIWDEYGRQYPVHGPRGDFDADGLINVLDADGDDDGLEVGEELAYGASPTSKDTDGDGCGDGHDPWPDRAEKYQLVVDRLHYNGSKEMDLRIQATLGKAYPLIPAANESFSVVPGQSVENLTHRPVPLVDCLKSPVVYARVPTMTVGLFVQDAATGEQLAFGPALGTWNVRSGAVGLGERMDRLVMEGPDGRLEGRLIVVFS